MLVRLLENLGALKNDVPGTQGFTTGCIGRTERLWWFFSSAGGKRESLGINREEDRRG